MKSKRKNCSLKNFEYEVKNIRVFIDLTYNFLDCFVGVQLRVVKMSDDEHLSLHSYDPFKDENQNDDIDEFYKELSLQFYGEDKKKKVSLLMSGSTQETYKPSRDMLTDFKKGFTFLKASSSRAGSPKCGRNQVQRKSPNQKQQSSPTTIKMIQSKKLIQLLQSPYNVKNKQKQTFLKKQIDMIKKIQVQELKEHYYK